MKVIDDDDASLLPKIGADGFPLGGTVTRAREYREKKEKVLASSKRNNKQLGLAWQDYQVVLRSVTPSQYSREFPPHAISLAIDVDFRHRHTPVE